MLTQGKPQPDQISRHIDASTASVRANDVPAESIQRRGPCIGRIPRMFDDLETEISQSLFSGKTWAFDVLRQQIGAVGRHKHPAEGATVGTPNDRVLPTGGQPRNTARTR